MITEFLVNFFFNVSNTLFNFIPDFEIPSLAGAVDGIIFVFHSISPFMPMSAFTVGIYVFVGINAFKLSVSIFNFIIRKIPTID